MSSQLKSRNQQYFKSTLKLNGPVRNKSFGVQKDYSSSRSPTENAETPNDQFNIGPRETPIFEP